MPETKAEPKPPPDSLAPISRVDVKKVIPDKKTQAEIDEERIIRELDNDQGTDVE